MMIRDSLIPAVQSAFCGWEFEVNSAENPIIRFPGIQKEVGDVLIHDDGDEVTVYVEHISHGHFNPYDEKISEAQRNLIIAEDVISFLQALFADRVLLFTTPDNRIGGWIRLDLCDAPVELSSGRSYYLWSRPYETE